VTALSRLTRTVRAWEAEILAWHATEGCSNGPTEAVNLLIKKIKRVGHGFRNFGNYRLRLLPHCGVTWQTPQTARLRGRSPRRVAWSRLILQLHLPDAVGPARRRRWLAAPPAGGRWWRCAVGRPCSAQPTIRLSLFER
jgi:hypothetical protein